MAILHRSHAGRFEVFWCRRADNLAFLGGFWAFPGGRVEAGETRVQAAARELREETGVSLPADPGRFLDVGATITPDWATIRFDATYFLVEAPPGAAPDVSVAGGELTDGEWVAPADALAAWERGERLTSPVVTHVLRALAPGLDGAAARLGAFAARGGWQSRAWELVPGLWMAALRAPTLPPATHTNCFLIGGPEMIVVDPGSPYPEEQEALDASLDALAREGRRVREIWITHHHFDHAGGAAHLARRLGVPVAAHPLTAKLLRGTVDVARLLADDEVVEAAPRRVRCLFTPGHTVGHHCFLEETTGFLLAGDMVAGVGTIVVDPDEGDMADYLASLARMKAVAPRVLLPAHGPVLCSPAAKLDEYVKHRLWREERVRRALAGRGEASAAELVAEVYDDVPPGLFPLAERSLISHLQKLVKDGVATQVQSAGAVGMRWRGGRRAGSL